MTERDGAAKPAENINESSRQREAWTPPTVVQLGELVEHTMGDTGSGGDNLTFS